jgi:hypothetical protein
VASTSVAICDESPQLQSNGPTVTKEKYIVAYIFCAYLIVSRIMKLILNKINSSGEIHFGKNIKINKDDSKLNYPLNPVHKRSAPTLHVAPVKGRNLVLMKKKTSSYRQLWSIKLFITDQKVIYVITTPVTRSHNLFS